MCIIFHKWGKWEQYTEEGTVYGGHLHWGPPYPYTERRQRRKCEKCGKEQDEMVLPS